MKFTARDILAILMVIGCFGLLGGYLALGGKLDTATGVALSIFCTAPITGILGFYFGRVNGQAEANINTMLDNQRTIISQLPASK